MSLRIELRYAILSALILLLFLILEFVAGFQDTLIAYHPYVSLLAFIIPVFTYRMALIEKIDQKFGKLTLAQAVFCGLITTLFFHFSPIGLIGLILLYHHLILFHHHKKPLTGQA